MGRFSGFTNSLGRFIKTRHRLLAAFLFLLIIAVVFITAIKKDFELRESQHFLGGIPGGRLNNYILTFTSIDGNNQTANGSLSFKAGLPIWEGKEARILYGELAYADLTYTYVIFPKEHTDLMAGLITISSKQKSSFTESKPKSKDVSIKMFGNREIYPFDKYLIVGAVRCPAYIDNGEKQTDITDLKDEESLSINNFMPGVFMRKPRQGELSQAKSAFVGKAQVVTEKEVKELNNYKNKFALIIERPIFLQLLTIILGIMALGSAVYIGWVARFDAIPLQIAGYVVALWGIRNNLLVEVKSFPSYIDYGMLFMYLVIFSGIIFRKIAGKAKQSGQILPRNKR